MKRILFFNFLLIFLIIDGNAQRFAVHFDTPSFEQPVNRKKYDECVDVLKNRLQLDSWVYVDKDDALDTDGLYRTGDDEKAADYLLTIYFDIWENYKPDLYFKKDTTGKVTGTYFSLRSLTKYMFILTDLRTNEILYYDGKYNQTTTEYQGGSMTVDMATYFGKSDPAILQARAPRDYSLIMSRIWTDYQGKLQEFYESKTPGFRSKLATAVMNPVLNKPYKIESPILDNGKLKEFTITATPGVKYFKDLFVTVFSLDTVDNYVIPQNYKWWTVKEINGDKCHMDTYFPIPSRNKDAGEAYENGRQLYYLPGDAPYSGHLKPEETITIDIRNIDLHAAGDMFNFLSRSPRLRLINSIQKPLIDKFHERFKSGRFVDSGYGLTLLGARYILTASDDQYSVLDAESGTVIGNSPKNYGDKGVYDLLQKALDLKVEIIKPTNEKKGAIKEALVYSPLGFYEDFAFDVMLVTTENVNGKSLQREEEIGKGNVYDEEKFGYVFAEARFTKGEKEIGEAYFGKKKLLFINREFKLPFFGTFK